MYGFAHAEDMVLLALKESKGCLPIEVERYATKAMRYNRLEHDRIIASQQTHKKEKVGSLVSRTLAIYDAVIGCRNERMIS